MKTSVKKEVEKMLVQLPNTKTARRLREKYQRTHTLSKRDLKILTKLVNELEETEAA